MKISFSTETSYTPEWRGNNELDAAEQVTATVKPMNVSDLLFLLDAFSEAGVEGEVDVDGISTDQLKPILKSTGHLLPEYVEVHNLTKEDGTPISIQEVVEFPFFMNLAAELLMKLAEFSSPSDDDVGNSNAPPAGEQAPSLPVA